MIARLKHAILKYKQEITLISILVILALILRMWRANEFAIFLSDQAIDSYAVKNIIEGNLTLLGPRASVGQFFNGPAIYYLMIPFFYILKSDPLAGTYFQIFLQLATIPLIYLLGRRIGTNLTGYLAAVLFALSPLFIYYSKSAFNSYPVLFLSTLIMYLLTFEKRRIWQFVIAGFVTGLMVQAHYLLYAYAFFNFVHVLLQKSVKRISAYLAGAFVGISPFLLFELRHSFFNLNAIFRHAINGGGERIALPERLVQFSTSISQILGYSDIFLGFALVFIITFALFLYCKKQNMVNNIYTWSFVALITSLVVYSGTIQTHYLIGIQPTLILFIAYFATSIKINNKYILALSFFLITTTFMNVGKNYMLPKEQDGLGLADQRKVANIIESEVSKIKANNSDIKWNVTQDLQQDNRALPIRYLVSLKKEMFQSLSVEDYSSNSLLFLIIHAEKMPTQVKTWEYQSFGDKYDIYGRYKINKEVDMYLLRK